MSNTPRARGSHALGNEPRKGGAWWKWLLGLLLLIALVVALILLLSGNSDDKKTGGATPISTMNSTNGGGELTGGGQSLLGKSDASLAQYAGTEGKGRAVKVLSVVEGKGFFVGTSSDDRVYIEYGGAVGPDEDADAYKPVVGDKVDLTGPVRAAPVDPAKTLELSPEDAQLVTTEGAYVNASEVSKTP